MSMFQSLKHNFKELILILWIMIPEHANKYGNIMLINVMKFDRLILKKVCTNLPKKIFFSAYFWPPQAWNPASVPVIKPKGCLTTITNGLFDPNTSYFPNKLQNLILTPRAILTLQELQLNRYSPFLFYKGSV